MDQVTRVKKYLKKEQWQKLIKDCQNSGMTVTAWCKANGICEFRKRKLPMAQKRKRCESDLMAAVSLADGGIGGGENI